MILNHQVPGVKVRCQSTEIMKMAAEISRRVAEEVVQAVVGRRNEAENIRLIILNTFLLISSTLGLFCLNQHSFASFFVRKISNAEPSKGPQAKGREMLYFTYLLI